MQSLLAGEFWPNPKPSCLSSHAGRNNQTSALRLSSRTTRVSATRISCRSFGLASASRWPKQQLAATLEYPDPYAHRGAANARGTYKTVCATKVWAKLLDPLADPAQKWTCRCLFKCRFSETAQAAPRLMPECFVGTRRRLVARDGVRGSSRSPDCTYRPASSITATTCSHMKPRSISMRTTNRGSFLNRIDPLRSHYWGSRSSCGCSTTRHRDCDTYSTSGNVLPLSHLHHYTRRQLATFCERSCSAGQNKPPQRLRIFAVFILLLDKDKSPKITKDHWAST